MSVAAFTTALLLTTTALPVDSVSVPAATNAQAATAEPQESSGTRPPAEGGGVATLPTLAVPSLAGQGEVTQQQAAPAQLQPPVAPETSAPVDASPTPPAEVPPALQDEGAEGNEIIVTARPRFAPGDPFQAINAQSYAVIQSVDKAFVGPVALQYKDTVPRPIRSGVRNFLNNLQEPVVFLNYLLQFKIGKAAETAGRFAINTTLGIGGLFDSAKKHPFNLPRRNNGFGYTLGFYGVKPGPFFFLPLIGPTTLRDVFGRLIDLSIVPFVAGKPFSEPLYAIPTTIVRLLDERAEHDEELRTISETSDPYTASKENYLQQRQAEIDALRGRSSSSRKGAEGLPVSSAPVSSLDGITPESVSPVASDAPAVANPLPEVPVFDGLSADHAKPIKMPEEGGDSLPAPSQSGARQSPQGDQAPRELQPQH